MDMSFSLRRKNQAGGDPDRRLAAEDVDEDKLAVARCLAGIDRAKDHRRWSP